MGVLRLVTPEGLKDVEVDAAAALAMAVHLALPIFMDANISSSDSPAPTQNFNRAAGLPQITKAFRQLLEGSSYAGP